MTPPLTGSNATDAYLGLTLILVGFTGITCLVLGWLDWKERRDAMQDQVGECGSPAVR